MNQRVCGTCAACCYVPGVESLGKPDYELCQHAGEAGCGIYERRPRACRKYVCLWLEEELCDLGDRPDRLGLMFDLPSDVESHPHYQGILSICAREVWPESRNGSRAADLLRRIARRMVVRLSGPSTKTVLIGPQRLVEVLVQRAASEGGSPA